MALGLHRPLAARLIAEPAVELVGNLPARGSRERTLGWAIRLFLPCEACRSESRCHSERSEESRSSLKTLDPSLRSERQISVQPYFLSVAGRLSGPNWVIQ